MGVKGHDACNGLRSDGRKCKLLGRAAPRPWRSHGFKGTPCGRQCTVAGWGRGSSLLGGARPTGQQLGPECHPPPHRGLESIRAMPRSATWWRLSAAPVPRVLPDSGVWGRPRSPWLMGKDAGPQDHSVEAPSSATLVTGAWTLHFLLCSGTWACSGSICLRGGGAFLVYRGKP